MFMLYSQTALLLFSTGQGHRGFTVCANSFQSKFALSYLVPTAPFGFRPGSHVFTRRYWRDHILFYPPALTDMLKFGASSHSTQAAWL